MRVASTTPLHPFPPTLTKQKEKEYGRQGIYLTPEQLEAVYPRSVWRIVCPMGHIVKADRGESRKWCPAEGCGKPVKLLSPDIDARHIMYLAHERLITKVLHVTLKVKADLLDQAREEAALELIRAIEEADPWRGRAVGESGVKSFGAYAEERIRRATLKLLDQARLARVARGTGGRSRRPAEPELSGREIGRLKRGVLSFEGLEEANDRESDGLLDDQAEDRGLGDLDKAAGEEGSLFSDQNMNWLREAVGELGEGDQLFLGRLYGVYGFQKRSATDLAKVYGCSASNISMWKSRILERLKKKLEEMKGKAD